MRDQRERERASAWGKNGTYTVIVVFLPLYSMPHDRLFDAITRYLEIRLLLSLGYNSIYTKGHLEAYCRKVHVINNLPVWFLRFGSYDLPVQASAAKSGNSQH